MGLKEDCEKWLNEHHTVRKFLLVMGASVVGFLLQNQQEILAAIPDNVGMIPLQQIVLVGIVPLLMAAHNWFKYNTSSVPGVSAKPSKKK